MHRKLISVSFLQIPSRNFVFRRANQRSLKQKVEKPFHPNDRIAGSVQPPQNDKAQQPKIDENPLRFDSTMTLIKKYYIYKMMGSNLFINHSLRAMKLFYKIMGVRLTNMAIEKTASSIFTGGVTLEDLIKDVEHLEKQNIGSIAMNVVEGLRQVSEKTLDDFLTFSLKTTTALTEGRSEGHFAVKLTAFVSTEVMEKCSKAQQYFAQEILQVKYDPNDDSVLTKEQLRQNLAKIGLKCSEVTSPEFYSELELDQLCNSVCSEEGNMTNIHRIRTPLEEKIAAHFCMTVEDLKKLDLFIGRVNTLTDYAQKRNCSLYIDAEQTFIQSGIESFGQQMTHKLNQGDQVIIMNGYQCYLKRIGKVIPIEVKSSQVFNYNLGIKLIRGAYMNEERELASKFKYESPVWDTIEETHACYNSNLQLIISNMKIDDMVFVASHNVDTVALATDLTEKFGFKESERVRFGQLRGFSDAVTGRLAAQGFMVYKYIPFGPTEEVMPYLIRRGQESRQVLREQKFQNETLKSEIYARMKPF